LTVHPGRSDDPGDDRKEAYYDDEPQAAPPPTAPAEPDMASQLQELAKLKEQGILTEEEFQAKKKQILDL
jgi:Short C-terminal domain